MQVSRSGRFAPEERNTTSYRIRGRMGITDGPDAVPKKNSSALHAGNFNDTNSRSGKLLLVSVSTVFVQSHAGLMTIFPLTTPTVISINTAQGIISIQAYVH